MNPCRRKVLASLVALALAGCGGGTLQNDSGDSPEIFLVAGQSNGYSGANPLDYRAFAFAPNRCLLISEEETIPIPGVLDAGITPSSVGLSYIHMVNALARPRPLVFVILARGSSSTLEWRSGPLLDRLLRAEDAYKPKAILWTQGEADCGYGFTQAECYGNMAAMVSRTHTPWIVALDGYPNPDYQHFPVRHAQRQLIDNFPNVHEGPDIDAIRAQSGFHIHLYGDQLRVNGVAWASAVQRAGL